ncbi:DNA-binding transcriptional ArsR family regulator [Lewinella aquimaris]|uniref:DNA-binding transcriptional ArsR family regulator n=1 Tax=Neolewinella aquimaris TaxID=1835722 RepID=A0A840E5Q4_9BACT|nr:metalloregulator ArsR/SmtB family transcription factor [Neolewinella aquimaris]MBB4079042.1 DNA-binding transcriptional ArsR family regulator [Neolewinella aquimaris]
MLPNDQNHPPDPDDRRLNIDSEQLRRAVSLLRALNHDLRRDIIELLKSEGKITVTDIFVSLRIEQSVASQHLAILRKAEIVISERDGKYIFYSLDREKLEKIVDFIANLQN